MGKNRKSGGNPTNSSNGETPIRSNMEIPQDSNSVTMMPEENPGTRTTLQQNEDKINEELNELYSQIFEVDQDRSTAWGAYYSQQEVVEKLQEQAGAVEGMNNPASVQIRKNLRDAQTKLEQNRTFAEEQQRKFDEMNRRIHTLETGFDTGDNANWLDEIESGEDEHGL